MTMWILSALPFVVFGALNMVSPEFIGPALTNPLGLAGFGLVFVLLAIGIVMMRKIGNIKV